MENIYLSGAWGFVTRHLYAVVARTSGSFKASACRKPLSKQQSQSPFHLRLKNPVTHMLLHHTQQHYTNSKAQTSYVQCDMDTYTSDMFRGQM